MPEAVDLGRVIPRNAILERLRIAQPRIITLVAPAGFGKSTVVRQFIEGREGVAICDCAYVSDEVDFARRIISALAEEEPERSATLSQRQLLIGDDSASSAERIAIALAAWRDHTRSSIFVFENGERIPDLPEVRELFMRLLAERPETRCVVVCSRVGLRLHLTRFAAPHQIVSLRADELAFDRRDLDVLFGSQLDTITLDRIYATSQGWPIAVFLLARFAGEGRLNALLERLGDIAFEELHDYLTDEVIESLPKPVVDALFAAACIPGATDDDIAIATGNPYAGETLAQYAHGSPFIRVSAGEEYIVHPLLAGTLTQHAAARRAELLASTAATHEERGDFLRAAELFLANADQEAAARALESFPVGDDRAPSMRYSRLLSSLDRDLVRRYPTLWSCNALFQMFSTDCHQLLNETKYLWGALPQETPMQKRYYLVATNVLLLVYLGRFAEALAFIEQVAPSNDPSRTYSELELGYKMFLRGTTLARMGRIDEAERDLLGALPFADRMDVMASAVVMLLGSEVARVRGDIVEERDRLAISLEYARRSELSNFVAYRLAEAVFGSWLWGDRDALRSFADELRSIVDGYGIRGFGFFSSCVLGDSDVPPRDVDLLRWVVCGHLIAAGNAEERESALRHAKAADKACDEYPNPFLQTLAALAVAELSESSESAEHYDRASRFARDAGSPKVLQAVLQVRNGKNDGGMLRVFAERLRTFHGSVIPPIDISVLQGTVFAAGREVHLGDREMALAIILALRPEAVPQKRLVEMLWTDNDDDSASNALYACLHRLRNRVGDGVILRTEAGLRLCDGAHVDLWSLERQLLPVRSRELASRAEYDAIMSVYRQLRQDRPARFGEWEWFAPIERYLVELRCEVALHLGRYAIRSGACREALALAREMIARDPCDEGAREIAITAYLSLGDRAAARQHYRQYRAALIEELRCEPSPSIAALVGVAADP